MPDMSVLYTPCISRPDTNRLPPKSAFRPSPTPPDDMMHMTAHDSSNKSSPGKAVKAGSRVPEVGCLPNPLRPPRATRSNSKSPSTSPPQPDSPPGSPRPSTAPPSGPPAAPSLTNHNAAANNPASNHRLITTLLTPQTKKTPLPISTNLRVSCDFSAGAKR